MFRDQKVWLYLIHFNFLLKFLIVVSGIYFSLTFFLGSLVRSVFVLIWLFYVLFVEIYFFQFFFNWRCSVVLFQCFDFVSILCLRLFYWLFQNTIQIFLVVVSDFFLSDILVAFHIFQKLVFLVELMYHEFVWYFIARMFLLDWDLRFLLWSTRSGCKFDRIDICSIWLGFYDQFCFTLIDVT